jgi:hypothetical protein
MSKEKGKRDRKRAKKGAKSRGKMRIPLDFETAVRGLLAVKPAKKKSS